jgi:hypothetical protein
MDDRHGTAVNENNGDEWSSDGVVLWSGKWQNGDAVEWSGEWTMLRWHFYSSGGWKSVVQGGWLVAVVQIQYFCFGLRGEATGWSIVGRWSGGNELILAPWKGSVTRRSGVVTSVEGEVAPGRGKGGVNDGWADTNLIGSKN